MSGKKNINKILIKSMYIIIVIVLIIFQTGCRKIDLAVYGENYSENEAVQITDMGDYYDVILDFTKGFSHEEVGQQYGNAILEVVPNYEELVDSYIEETVRTTNWYNEMLVYRVPDMLPQVNPSYTDEIKGISSVFSAQNDDVMGDGKISINEFYLFNLIPDVVYGTACSVAGVFDSRSETGNNILYRNLDWFGGSNNQIPKISAVITVKTKQNDVCLIGYLGYMGAITAINDNKTFGAILNAPTGTNFTAMGRSSYPFDLREALEQEDTLEQVGEFMLDSTRHYSFNHIIALADPKETKILENNFSGLGPEDNRVKRAIRDSESELNKNVEWSISDAIGSVNSFILKGNYDNHTDNDLNTERWDSIKEQLLDKGEKVSFEEMKDIASYDDGEPQYMDYGDLYCKMTQQIVVIEPETFKLEMFFYPKNALKSPQDPIFIEVNIFENLK